MPKILTLLILPIIALVVLYFASFYIYPQLPTVVTFKLYNSRKMSDSVNVTPTQHIVSSVAPKQGKTYQYGGVAITTDWSETEIRSGQNAQFIQFENDGLIVLNGSRAEANLYDILQQKMLTESSAQNVATYFTNAGISSNQDTFEKMLTSTKSDITIDQHMDNLTLTMVLLHIKAGVILDAQEILSYQIGDKTFYQFSPFNDNTLYELIFFDNLDTQHSISIKKQNITQQEIESIAKTIKIQN